MLDIHIPCAHAAIAQLVNKWGQAGGPARNQMRPAWWGTQVECHRATMHAHSTHLAHTYKGGARGAHCEGLCLAQGHTAAMGLHTHLGRP